MSTTAKTSPTLPENKRYIVTHNSDGKSIYDQSSSSDQSFMTTGRGVSMAKSYSVANIPSNLTDDVDVKAYLAGPESSVTSFQRPEIVVPSDNGKNNGSNLLVVDFVPGGFSAMHRTVSIDYSICVIGSVIHELDSGERVTLYPGDHIVQRGTNHRWINASTTNPARIIAVTMPCVPFKVSGTTIEETFDADDADYVPKR